ncbi:MAG: periplasmic heavy metal sensor [Calditrichales bacterium]|nr:periplasmic heavy metal sensor [Calditrichales bacterium]
MENPKKNRIMQWTIIVLLIMNIITIALLWFSQFKKPKPFPPAGTQESLIEGARFLKMELNLSEIQIQQFIDSRNRHAEISKKTHNKIHQFKKQILDESFKSVPDSIKIQALSNEIGKQQAEFERNLAMHFFELKSYCDPEQREKLKALFQDMAAKTRPRKPSASPAEHED